MHIYIYIVLRVKLMIAESVLFTKKNPQVTTPCCSSHMESTETYSAPFQVKGKKIKRISWAETAAFSAFENWLLFLTILIKALYSFLFVFFWTYSHYWAQIKEDASIFFGVTEIKGNILLEVRVSGPAQCSTQFNESLFTKVGLPEQVVCSAASLCSIYSTTLQTAVIYREARWFRKQFNKLHKYLNEY